VRAIMAERSRVTDELSRTSWGFTASQANFILVRPDSDPDAGSPGIHEQLLRLGVIVRDGAALGCSGRLRVSIGTPDENDVFLSARTLVARSAPRETQPGRTTR
jgi:histidinol-phosphate aminotransferase